MKLSTFLSALAWTSLLALAWLLLLRRIPFDWLSGLLFAFFLLVALLAGGISTVKQADPHA